MALPTMAAGCGREVVVDWCRAVDDGPFSSVSCGERITFHNPEMVATLAAAAVLTSRVRVFVNLSVLPMHPHALAAKQLATLDVLSGGRLSVGVGVGGREHDYRACAAPWEDRHRRLDRAVAEMRRLWSGEPPFEGADPVGPPTVAPGGPEILAGAMGPKAMARAACWADGVSGFSVTADAEEMSGSVRAARTAWEAAGRAAPPRTVTGCFAVLGTADPRGDLRSFTATYLAIFGRSFAARVAEEVPVWSPARLREALDRAEEAGVDEFIVVSGTTDLACAAEVAEVVRSR